MLCEKCERFCAEISQRLRGDFNSSDAETELLPLTPIVSMAELISSSRWPSHEMILFHNLEELKLARERQCSICRCISRSIDASELEQLRGGPYETSLILTPSTGRPSLRVRLTDCSGDSPTEIVVENIATYYPSIMKSPSLATTLGRCSELENNSTGSLASFELARYWLSECLEKHPDCPKPGLSKLPTRLLDVEPLDQPQSVRLVESAEILDSLPPSQRRYIALSHCWGKEQILTTTLATLQDRKTNIYMEDLSNTFRDAVIATRCLGLRYLWIDSMCIIQDSAEDWKNESVQMCAVYQGAVVTIAAAHASSGHGGCFAQRDGSAQMPFSMPFHTSESAETTNVFFLPLSVSGMSLNISDEQPLLTRAWVLQEQVLSRALLVYHREELWWECHTMQMSERSPDGASLMRAYENLTRALVGMNDPFDSIRPDVSSAWLEGQTDEEDLERGMHTQWCELVMDYTRRGITKTTDRLIALDGIAQTISSRTPNRYIAGLWRDQLVPGLMWSIPWDTHYGLQFWEQAKDPTLSLCSSRHETVLAPSWSWASVTFPVTWPFISETYSMLAGMKLLCDVVDVGVKGTPFYQKGAVVIRGLSHSLYVDPVYQQYHFTGKSRDNPRIGELGISEHNRSEPSSFPSTCSVSLVPANRPADFRPFPMLFLPDELLDRRDKITFLALAEVPPSGHPTTLEHHSMHSILTLALIPTGRNPHEYRRVGLARWYNCSWYGYYCIGDSYYRSHWEELRIQKMTRGWRMALRDLLNKCWCWLIGGLLNQPIIQHPVGKLWWFSHLVNGKWGRHCRSLDPRTSQSYRNGWEAKLETITIV